MKKRSVMLALLMIPTAAFAQSTAETTGVNSVLNIPPKTEDFVKEVSKMPMRMPSMSSNAMLLKVTMPT